MTNTKLQALRNFLFLSVAEAAEHIGNVTPRTWQYWESGRVPVPNDVAYNIQDMIDLRQRKYEDSREKAKADPSFSFNYYQRHEDYIAAGNVGSVVFWRITQSVAAQLMAEEIGRPVSVGKADTDENGNN